MTWNIANYVFCNVLDVFFYIKRNKQASLSDFASHGSPDINGHTLYIDIKDQVLSVCSNLCGGVEFIIYIPKQPRQEVMELYHVTMAAW